MANVYTWPVSEATRRRTWVPVSVLSSYACIGGGEVEGKLLTTPTKEKKKQEKKKKKKDSHLLHDAGLSLAEGDVPAALVLNELNVNLPAPGLLVSLVVVAVVVLKLIRLLLGLGSRWHGLRLGLSLGDLPLLAGNMLPAIPGELAFREIVLVRHVFLVFSFDGLISRGAAFPVGCWG